MEILDRFKEITVQSSLPVVLEFGACDGTHTNIMLNILRSNKTPFIYHAFEPHPHLIQAIKGMTIAHDGLFKLFKMAIGNQDGTADFFISSGQKTEQGRLIEEYYGSSSIRKPLLVTDIWKDMQFRKATTEVVTLNTHYSNTELNGHIIDFIWADIQGAEIDLIKGGFEVLSKKVRYLYTEYCDTELYEGEISKKQIMDMLPDFEMVEDYGTDILLKNKNL